MIPKFKSNPIAYVSHLIGHEGENSLMSLLSDEGLALEIASGHFDMMNNTTILTIELLLTQKGLQNCKQVIEFVFAYVKILKEKGIQKWIFEEIQLVKNLKFDNKDKEQTMNYVLTLGSYMQKYPV